MAVGREHQLKRAKKKSVRWGTLFGGKGGKGGSNGGIQLLKGLECLGKRVSLWGKRGQVVWGWGKKV